MRQSSHRAVGRWGRIIAAGAMGVTLAVTVLSTSSPAGAASTPGVTSTTVTIGATTPLTGPAAPGYDEIAPAMQAIFAWANANGGVNGRKIHLPGRRLQPGQHRHPDPQAGLAGQHLR
jgi:ABC-type branched-subunit amino acid transport system substrate-binding protein